MGTTKLEIDPWASNPLVDGFTAKNPTIVKAALAERPAPTLFTNWDLPPFTASGVDPQFLMWLPFGCRHYAASEPRPAAVLQLIEESGRDPDASVDSDGLNDYLRRVVDWITGRGVDPELQASQAAHATYDQIFGEAEAADAARRFEQNKAQADLLAMKTRTGAYADPGRATR
ncbi:hypothetical protein BJ986_000207 [Phycicoccus badiiscoriae]|uniref:Uncharacterized protein n=1 Tax=Pedococcus badiiscoriae TaxID=642776 RepID=A0A852WAS0_9MICO|nr:hypothetical protein [Pedococcus badiiscoriae]NYG05720.1 hypothetical protein [Pedococcus badiiscoriae]